MNFSFRVDANAREPYYEAEIEAMRPNESNTMFVDFSHVMRYNDLLQKAISDEFLRQYFDTILFIELLLTIFWQFLKWDGENKLNGGLDS